MGGSPGFGSQLGHSSADYCEQVTSPSDTPFLQGLCEMDIRLSTVLVWPGLGPDVRESTRPTVGARGTTSRFCRLWNSSRRGYAAVMLTEGTSG